MRPPSPQPRPCIFIIINDINGHYYDDRDKFIDDHDHIYDDGLMSSGLPYHC